MQDKKNSLWNFYAGIVNAAQSIIILFIASRVNTIDEVGMLTIGFSLGNLFMTIGKFGLRNYQVAHEGYDIPGKTFFNTKIVTTCSMFMVVTIFVVINYFSGNYSAHKSIIIFGVCLLYVIEAFEEFYISSFQVLGRLDIGNKIFIIRWFGIFTVFIVTDILTKKIISSIVLADITSIFLEIILVLYFVHKYSINKQDKFNYSVKALIIKALPLFIAAFGYFYITNVQKYAVDYYLLDEDTAVFGYISMPVFVIPLLNNILYMPQLNYLIKDFRDKNIKAFAKRVIKQIIIIICLLMITVICGWLFGLKILSFFFNYELIVYLRSFIIILLGSGFLAVGGYMSTLLIVMEKIICNMLINIGCMIIATINSFFFVCKFGISGAAYGYIITMFVQMMLFSLFVLLFIMKDRFMREKNEN